MRLLLPARDREFIVGDLDEEFQVVRLPRDGRWSATRWYWRQALASLFSEVKYGLGDAPAVAAGAPNQCGSWFDPLRQDLRFALRSLNRRPVFTTVAVLTLALGIGANTAIFSIANWLLLRPVPGVSRAHELAVAEIAAEPGQSSGISWQNFADMARGQHSFSGLAGYGHTSLQVMSGAGQPEAILAQAVGGDYFGVLGLRMQLGRPISAIETEDGNPAHVIVLGDALWQQLYQRSPGAVGSTLLVNRIALTVIGVAPAGFQGVERNGGVQAWVPLSIQHELRHASPEFAALLRSRGGGTMRELVGRLQPGVTAEAARADLQHVVAVLRAQYPEETQRFERRRVFVHEGIGVPVLLREQTARTVRLMMVVVAMLLAISAANVGNMMLVRGLEARPAAALRRALGASTTRLVAQQLAECFVIALAGGVASLLVARAFLNLAEGGRLLGLPTLTNIPIDLRVLGFTALVALGSGLLFALAPALVLRGAHPARGLRQSNARFTGKGQRARNVIATLQVALSLTMLAGALLLTRTLLTLQRVHLGFDADRVAGFYVNSEPQGYQSKNVGVFRRELLARVRQQPGIEQAGLAYAVPFGSGGFRAGVTDPLARSGDPIPVDVQFVSEGYLETLGISPLRGRTIEERDWVAPGNEPSVVLSEAAARALFGERDPLGRVLEWRAFERPRLRVVGVVRDARITELHEAMPTLIYLPIHLYPTTQISVVLRGRGDMVALESAARKALRALDPALPMRFEPLRSNIRNSIVEQRLLATLFSAFSLLALALAGIGLYGILAFMVGERTREIGIRRALGAPARSIASLVAARAALIVIPGLLLGVLAARWLETVIEGTLYGVSRLGIPTYLLALAIFALIAALATAVPTRSAARVQPTSALRQQ